MYNILLTDDEQIVVDSLEFILQKNFSGQFNIFKENSGADAINICRTNKIDIIIMDINMPGLNGLQSVKEIKQLTPQTIFIMLSAFDRFKYAQEALELGVYRYLTKPVNRDTVIQTVHGAINLLESEKQKLSDTIELREKLSFGYSIVESDFIYALVLSSENKKELSNYFDYFNINPETYYFCCIEVPENLSEDRGNIYMQIRDAFCSKTDCIMGSYIMNRITIFIPVERKVRAFSNDAEIAEDKCRSFLKDIFNMLALKISSSIRMGAGGIFDDISRSAQAYNEALNALNASDMTGGIKFYEEGDAENRSDIKKELNNAQKALLGRISAGDTDGVKSAAELWFDIIRSEVQDIDLIKNETFNILVSAKNFCRLSVPSATFKEISACRTSGELFAYVLPKLIECSEVILEESVRRSNPVIANAIKYINERVALSISLEQAAKAVHVNPVYLSKLFKDETGKNFIDYVTDIRLDRAKEMLKAGQYSIKEITAETGYSDQNYFSRLFKRKFGLTPTEFKKNMDKQ
ncbi:MAG: response regulator transcription factor [Treponema sp.]